MMSRKRAFCKKFFCCKNFDSESLRLARKRLSNARGIDRSEIIHISNFQKCCNTSVSCIPVKKSPIALTDLRFKRARVSASHRSSRAARGVNTSLSGKLFFLARWCIRDGVHLDSRVHAAIKPSHIGGQHGQESEEGEERSEESCEEDPQGLQEEVSLALTKMPAV